MLYLYLVRFINKQKDYDIQLLVFDIIKTKINKDYLHIELNNYYENRKKEIRNIINIYLFYQIFLLRKFNKNIKNNISIIEKKLLDTINRTISFINPNYKDFKIFEDSYIKLILSNDIIIHPNFINIILERLMYSFPIEQNDTLFNQLDNHLVISQYLK